MGRLRIPYMPQPPSSLPSPNPNHKNSSFYFMKQLNKHMHLAPENTGVGLVIYSQEGKKKNHNPE